MLSLTKPRNPALQPDTLDEEACWNAVCRRDRSADGTFFYSVRTTGVYCRPSCGARLPRRENVAFHASPAEADALATAFFILCRNQAH